jgi:hypothetical protein
MAKIKLTTTHKVTIAVGTLAAVATVAAALWKSQPSVAQSGAIFNNQGIVTQGQIGGTNTVINRQPPRQIDDQLRQFIRANVPKAKTIKVMVLNGDPERDNFAEEIGAFLTADGYKLMTPFISFLVGGGGKTPSGVEIGPDANDADVWVIKVGVNTR